MSLVAVVMPTYKGAQFLPTRLDGALQQTLPAGKVIVIDNGSPDNTPSVVAAYRDRVQYCRTENRGVRAARNPGASLADGEWIAFADQDGLWEPDHLERLMRLVRAASDLTLVFTDFRVLRNDSYQPGPKFQEAPPGWWEANINRRLAEGWILGHGFVEASFPFCTIFPSAKLCRR